MDPVSCSALLFDMDGVLVDSTPAVARVWHRWAIEHGFDPEEVVRQAHGRPSRSTIRELLPNCDVAAEDREVERREIEDLEGVIPLPGVQELLSALPPERWTIVTSCTRPLAEVRLRAAQLPVPKQFITASDIRHGKPDPEPYLKAASFLGYPPGDCIVVEDAPAGILAGRSAGARVIAFPTTMDIATLRKARPDWILRNCEDISASNHGTGLILSLAESVV